MTAGCLTWRHTNKRMSSRPRRRIFLHWRALHEEEERRDQHCDRHHRELDHLQTSPHPSIAGDGELTHLFVNVRRLLRQVMVPTLACELLDPSEMRTREWEDQWQGGEVENSPEQNRAA